MKKKIKTKGKRKPKQQQREKRPYRGDFPWMKSLRLTDEQHEFVTRMRQALKLYTDSDAIRGVIDAAMTAEKARTAA